MKHKRPVISIPRSLTESILDAISLIVLIGSFVYTAMSWSSLPEQVPIHFDMEGEADEWGSRMTLLWLPVINTIMFAGMTVLRSFPHKMNYLIEITPENAVYQYRLSIELLAWIKLQVVLLLGYLTWATIQEALGNTGVVSIWLLPITLFVPLVTIIIYSVRSLRGEK